MEKKRSIKGAGIALVGVITLLSLTAVAQEVRSEISLQGTGFFTKDANGNGIGQHATDTGGFLIGYRYNINRWLAAEGNYGYDRNTQIYFGGTGARVQSNIHQITGSAVMKLPGFARILRDEGPGPEEVQIAAAESSSEEFSNSPVTSRLTRQRTSRVKEEEPIHVLQHIDLVDAQSSRCLR